jgi:hypothetical protein
MTTHEDLLNIVPKLDSDFEPYGKRSRDDDWGPDCSCGCLHYIVLDDEKLRFDWGVCLNKQSPRFGLLTFEHQGCREYEDEPEDDLE